MTAFRFDAWRASFLAAGVLILAGAPRHPRGTMAQMLAHQDWFIAHAMMVAAYVALTAGLVLFARVPGLSATARRWSRLAAAAAALETVEMAVHTAASVDAANLVAGHATPVLTTHLWMALTIYPLFGIAIAVFMIKGMRERTVGSPWIIWLGLIGAVSHALVMSLVMLLEIPWAPILFPMILGLGLWLVLAALWPARAAARGSVVSTAPAA